LKGLLGLVRVAGNYRAEASGLGLQVEVAQVVKHVEGYVSAFDDDGGRKFSGPWSGVDVAAHGEDRSNGTEADENFGCANVACVENQVDAEQSALGFRAEKAVSIGDYADFHLPVSFLAVKKKYVRGMRIVRTCFCILSALRNRLGERLVFGPERRQPRMMQAIAPDEINHDKHEQGSDHQDGGGGLKANLQVAHI
jgi:hypothetical protein